MKKKNEKISYKPRVRVRGNRDSKNNDKKISNKNYYYKKQKK